MSNDPQPLAPYSANPYAAASAIAATGVEGRQRPSGLTVVGVLCIVAGIVGLLVGLIGSITLVFSSAMSSAFVPPGPQSQIQQEMNSKVQEVTATFMIPNAVIIVFTVGVCGCLLIGGLGVFRQQPRGRTLLRKALLLAMVLECLRIALNVATQLRMLPIMEEYMPKMMNEAGSNGPSGAMFGTMMRVMTLFTLAFWVVWGLVKLGLYAWGRSYLKKPVVVDFYGVAKDNGV